jgi:valyl-tRNA synthetase
MTTESKSTRYDFREIEPRTYRLWKARGCFRSAVDSEGNVLDRSRAGAKPYVIVIPPPNVTGRLHMGHALNDTIQDMLARYKRMDGYDVLWLPGTDHAGIATQTVVKKMLDEDGVDYRALGREKFIAKVWEWKEKYGGIILDQLARLGSCCDWERTRFTMDEGLTKAVMRAFKSLYDEGLIYRGKRIVNWCPVDRTALSDDEVETKEGGEPGFLWQIKYRLEDGSGYLVVATTRPETLFGDVAVAVNPKDERYAHLIGKNAVVPLQERVVPIIADDYVDMTFGTGCLKITPAHDPNDFEIGSRHGLAPINVMHEDARLNDVVPERYRGLTRGKAREQAVTELKERGLLVSEEPRMTPLGRSYRSKAVIEYRLSDQWFVKMKPLAEKVLTLHGDLDIVPKRWDKVYLDWLNNIRDWCVSRQIWWGHRIPAWYCENAERKEAACPPIVAETPPTQCPKCGSKTLRQDEDVLDTWFSSSLWPMSTLGWPENTPDFGRYFPTSTLVTGKDIIFFWVARMNMMAAHFTGQLPYSRVFINPIVLDEKGETMSKSKGNGIDPLVLINGATLDELKQPVLEARPSNAKDIIRRLEKNFPQGYEGVGTDALRYTLIYLCSSGQQVKISMDSFQDLGRRFLTKLWNAARFLMMYLEQEGEKGGEPPSDFAAHLTDEDRWIRARLNQTTSKVRECLDGHDFTNLGETYYHFVWGDFCDWYVELCKERLAASDALQRKTALHNLVAVFADTLKLLHPLLPFVTEELWQNLVPLADKFGLWEGPKSAVDFIMRAEFPKAAPLTATEEDVIARFDTLKNFVGQTRTLRKTYGIKDGEKISAQVLPLDPTTEHVVKNSAETIRRLANLSALDVLSAKPVKAKGVVAIIDPAFEAYLDISRYVDVEVEKKRLTKELEKLTLDLGGLEKRLGNESFVKNAKPEVVDQERAKLATLTDKLAKTKMLLEELA